MSLLYITENRLQVHRYRDERKNGIYVCRPGARICGHAFGLVIVDSGVTQDARFRDWYDTVVRIRLEKGALEL